MYDRVLVTGGAGFAGSRIALALKRRFPSCRVYALDNLRRRGSELNLPRLREAGVRFVHGDVRRPEDLADLPEAPEAIVECSAEPSAQSGYGGSPEYLVQTNLVGCYNCLELARRVKAAFLFLSTSRVYPVAPLNALAFEENDTRFVLAERQAVAGASGQGIGEDFPLQGARSLYGMTKLAAELMIAEYGDAYGVPYTIDRCGLIAGPWQMGKTDQGVAALWMAAHYFKRPLRYIGFGGAGKQVRDILHVDDLCDLLLGQLEDPVRWNGRVFNAGGGRGASLSLREMTALCEQITGNRIAPGSSAETRAADVRIYITDHARLTAFSGWRPRRDARATLVDLFEWMRGEEGLLRPILGEGGFREAH